MLPLQGMQDQFLVGGLRSPMLHGVAKNLKQQQEKIKQGERERKFICPTLPIFYISLVKVCSGQGWVLASSYSQVASSSPCSSCSGSHTHCGKWRMAMRRNWDSLGEWWGVSQVKGCGEGPLAEGTMLPSHREVWGAFPPCLMTRDCSRRRIHMSGGGRLKTEPELNRETLNSIL